MTAYAPDTPASFIISDGWARGFEISQTQRELAELGFNVSIEAIQREWDILTKTLADYQSELTSLEEF